VPLPSATADMLAEHLRAHPPGPGGLIVTRTGVTKPRTVMEAGVWTRRRAGHLCLAAAKAAGIPDGNTSHSLRHHYASILLDAGESVHAVSERIGDRPEMVLRIYGHLMPNREDTTRRAVDAAWQAARRSGDLPGTAGRKRIAAKVCP